MHSDALPQPVGPPGGELSEPVLPGRGRQRLRALPAYGRAAGAAGGSGELGPPRRAALPDRAPVVGAVAQARDDGGRRGDGADRPRRASGCHPPPAAARCSRSSTSPSSSTCSSTWHRGSTTRCARCSGTAAASTRPATARVRNVTPGLGGRSGGALESAGLDLVTLHREGRRARGALHARGAADRVGRTHLGLALPSLQGHLPVIARTSWGLREPRWRSGQAHHTSRGSPTCGRCRDPADRASRTSRLTG
jgi:hypothetical protein